MLKKISATLVLTAVLLFAGIFQAPVEAASNNADQGTTYKAVYNVNGQWGKISFDGVNKYFDWFKILQQKFTNNNWNVNKPAQDQVEQPAPEKQEKPVEKPAPEKQEEPEKPVTQQPEQQVPSTPTAPEAEVEVPNQNQNQSSQLSQFEQQVVELTNNERTKAGLAPLQADWELSRVAREKSRDMATRNYFDHNSPTYGSPFDMMQAYGINYRTAGENIAMGQRSPQEVVNAWMNSPGHRANILNGNFTHIGVGFVESGNHWTQMFIGK